MSLNIVKRFSKHGMDATSLAVLNTDSSLTCPVEKRYSLLPWYCEWTADETLTNERAAHSRGYEYHYNSKHCEDPYQMMPENVVT